MDIIDRIYEKNFDDILFEFFKNSKVKGKITRSYKYNQYIYRYDQEQLEFKGKIKTNKKIYNITIKMTPEEIKIIFGEFSFIYNYYGNDKFYRIYNEIKKGILPINKPEDFEKIEDTKFNLSCNTFKQIIEKLFKKADIICDTVISKEDRYSYLWE